MSKNRNQEGGCDNDPFNHAALPATNQVTLDEVMHQQNKVHIALADGFERAEYEVVLPEEKKVTMDEIMLHQNRALHNEDGFEPDDYRK